MTILTCKQSCRPSSNVQSLFNILTTSMFGIWLLNPNRVLVDYFIKHILFFGKQTNKQNKTSKSGLPDICFEFEERNMQSYLTPSNLLFCLCTILQHDLLTVWYHYRLRLRKGFTNNSTAFQIYKVQQRNRDKKSIDFFCFVILLT